MVYVVFLKKKTISYFSFFGLVYKSIFSISFFFVRLKKQNRNVTEINTNNGCVKRALLFVWVGECIGVLFDLSLVKIFMTDEDASAWY